MRKRLNLNTRGLRQCLRSFDSNGIYAKNGLWSIANGGYDLYWELYYQGKPLIDCKYHNELEIVNDYGFADIERILKVVLSEYRNCKFDFNSLCDEEY